MPNWADFNMRVRGKKENCEAFKAILYHENDNLYFHRTFPEDHFSEGVIDSDYYMDFYGECAWSYVSSMGSRHEYTECAPSSTICEISELLKLSIEIYTTEPGLCFAEHYHVKNGEVLSDECVDYEEYWWDEDEYPTLEEFNAASGTKFAMEDFADGYAWIGGFESWNWAS